MKNQKKKKNDINQMSENSKDVINKIGLEKEYNKVELESDSSQLSNFEEKVKNDDMI